MVDGKVCDSVTNTKSQRCYICGLTSIDFNNIEKVFNTQVDISKLNMGLSILHGWIRFFECLLHLSYKLPFKKWQARGEEHKKIVNIQKKLIQAKFRSQLDLLVDKPKPGFGATNGNTTRRFFDNADFSANITGIAIEIIKRFHIVLQTISTGFKINQEKFRIYIWETAQMFIK